MLIYFHLSRYNDTSLPLCTTAIYPYQCVPSKAFQYRAAVGTYIPGHSCWKAKIVSDMVLGTCVPPTT